MFFHLMKGFVMRLHLCLILAVCLLPVCTVNSEVENKYSQQYVALSGEWQRKSYDICYGTLSDNHFLSLHLYSTSLATSDFVEVEQYGDMVMVRHGDFAMIYTLKDGKLVDEVGAAASGSSPEPDTKSQPYAYGGFEHGGKILNDGNAILIYEKYTRDYGWYICSHEWQR